jgi:hypothetical protein
MMGTHVYLEVHPHRWQFLWQRLSCCACKKFVGILIIWISWNSGFHILVSERFRLYFLSQKRLSLRGWYIYLIALQTNYYCTTALLVTEIYINNKAYHTKCHYKIFSISVTRYTSNEVTFFYILLTMNHVMILGKWPTWCAISFLCIYFYL